MQYIAKDKDGVNRTRIVTVANKFDEDYENSDRMLIEIELLL